MYEERPSLRRLQIIVFLALVKLQLNINSLVTSPIKLKTIRSYQKIILTETLFVFSMQDIPI